MYFDQFKNRYYITAELIMERPLHIGRGVSLNPVGTDLPVVKDPMDRPFIPGSSIKGVIRSYTERLLRGVEDRKDRFDVETLACDIFSKPCVGKGKNAENNIEDIKEACKENGEINEDKFLSECWNKTCLTCRLFGSQWIASRVSFKDAHIDERTFLRTEIRDGVAIDRDTETARPRMKYDYEIVPSGARFQIDIVLENVEPWEAGLLGLVLNLWERGEIAIGGKSSAGLGWSRLKNIEIEKVEGSNLFEYLLEDKKEKVNIEDLIKALKDKLEG